MSEREVVIVDYARSAFGRLGGGLRDFAACEIGGEIIKGLVKKTGIMERAFVDSVIAGCAHGDSKTQAIARYACLYAGLPYETSATFVEMQCGSSIMALNQADTKEAEEQGKYILKSAGEEQGILTGKMYEESSFDLF